MTNASLARERCCNFTPEGGCLGKGFGAEWSAKFKGLRERDKCAMLQPAARPEACDFFRRCVHPTGPGEDRACPDCGGALERRKRYCERCANRRRRDAERRARRNKLVPKVEGATVKGKTGVISPESAGS